MDNEDTTAGQALYARWRSHADAVGCATYAWNGLTEQYKQAWLGLAASLLKPKTVIKSDHVNNGASHSTTI